MITFTLLGFTFVAYACNTFNMLVTNIILTITSREHFKFTYCMSVRDYSNSSVKRYVFTKKQLRMSLKRKHLRYVENSNRKVDINFYLAISIHLVTMVYVYISTGVVSGSLVSKLGQRKCMLIGSLLSSVGVFASSFAPSISFLVGFLGVVAGMKFSHFSQHGRVLWIFFKEAVT